MLMQTRGFKVEIEVESEALKNCRALLAYIDGKFQERLDSGFVDYNVIEMNDASGTYRCLIGWYAHDTGNAEYVCMGGTAYDNEVLEAEFGMEADRQECIFGSDYCGTLDQRRAALINHIATLEAS